MEEHLIMAVYNRRAIWDPSDELRKNSRILKSLWAEVAEEVGIGVHVAKTRWKNLRAYFITQFRDLGKVKSAGDGCMKTTSTWAFYNQLLFLKDVVVSSDCPREDSLASTKASEFFDQTQASDSHDEFDGDNFQESSVSDVGTEKETSAIANKLDTSTSLPEIVDTSTYNEDENNSQAGQKLTFHNRKVNINKWKLKSRSDERNINRELLEIERRKVKLLEREMSAGENPDLLFFKSLLPYMQMFTPSQKLRICSTIQMLILDEYESMQQDSSTNRYDPSMFTGLEASCQEPQYFSQSPASSVTSDSAQDHTPSTPSSAPQSDFRDATNQKRSTYKHEKEVPSELAIKFEDVDSEDLQGALFS